MEEARHTVKVPESAGFCLAQRPQLGLWAGCEGSRPGTQALLSGPPLHARHVVPSTCKPHRALGAGF